ncbi:hypothetical protein Q7689_23110 [Nocardiopsis tropica]|uniref:hypothetical protein n=1 Tax=Nocardiopsis tropica TaxID=109330 RepID=UPI002E8773BD|nr:hypothetical protein [Nocardiopsis tropica]
MTAPRPGPADPTRGPGGPAGPPLPAGSSTVLLVCAVLYPPAATGVLLVVGAFALFTATTGAAASAAWAGAGIAGLAAAHAALYAVLRGTGLPRPGATAVLLTASVALALAQTALMYPWFGVGPAWGPPLAAAAQGAAAALVLVSVRGRAVAWAAAALCAVALLRLPVAWAPEPAVPRAEAAHHEPAAVGLPHGDPRETAEQPRIHHQE